MFTKKLPWRFIPLLVLPSVFFLLFGNIRWAILSLGLVPVFFEKYREIRNNLTESERRELSRLSSAYGWKSGTVSGLWVAPVAVYFSFYNRDIPFLIWTALIFMSVETLLFSRRQRKPLVDFALSTEYAKKMGWVYNQGQENLPT